MKVGVFQLLKTEVPEWMNAVLSNYWYCLIWENFFGGVVIKRKVHELEATEWREICTGVTVSITKMHKYQKVCCFYWWRMQ